MIGLVVSTIIVFATGIESMDKESVPGLEVTLCITPILLLLSLNTPNDAKEHEDLLPSLCFEMAVDLVDRVEIVDIVLDQKEYNYGIPNAHGHAMVAIACISFLLSPWKMLENDFERGELLPKTALLRYIFDMALVNLVFLITRSVILNYVYTRTKVSGFVTNQERFDLLLLIFYFLEPQRTLIPSSCSE